MNDKFYGRCFLSMIPCRKEGNDRSEMLTQLLFGEEFEVLHQERNWSLIRTVYDDYECWIDSKQMERIEGLNNPDTFSVDVLKWSNEMSIWMPAGAVDPDGRNLEASPNSIVVNAMKFIGTPYLWGGRTAMGIDCSGFTQIIFKIHGLKIKRDAYQQILEGAEVDFLENAQNGDLAFFDNQEGKVTHVGIVFIENAQTKIIHASGHVRVDKLDHQGIFNSDFNKYTHNLKAIRRYVN